MAVVLTNNASSRLAVALTAGATSLSVTSGEGAKFPSLTPGDWFPLTLVKASGALEIVRCTARSGDVFTITRAQENTSAQAFSVGDRVELRLTAAAINEFKQTSSISTFMQGMLDDANAAEARGTLGLGTVATRDVQTSVVDATAGRALIVGAFGLGGFAPTRSAADISDRLTFGVSAASSGSPGLPVAVDSMILTVPWDNNSAALRLALVGDNTDAIKLYAGKRLASIERPWVELYHTGNISAYAQTLLDDADAAAARGTLGLGNAATATVTASTADRSIGRLTKHGDKQICSAWVDFDGTGTLAVRDSFNVSSVTDLGTGNYRLNFTGAMSNTNYSPNVSAKSEGSSTGNGLVSIPAGGKTTSTLNIVTGNGSGTLVDHAHVDVQIFGGL